MMDDYKNSDNFQGVKGRKMISPHHFHPTNGVRPADSISRRGIRQVPGGMALQRDEEVPYDDRVCRQ